MSRMENVITTTFRAYGSNVGAFMGDMGGRMTRFGQIVNENTRMSERLDRQWRAFGTTIRYALAGSAVFGLTRMVGQLRDVNSQLGTMQALSGIGGRGTNAFSNRQINQLGNDLQRVAVDTITPLNDVNEAAINFLSTVQDVNPSQLPTMLTQIGQAAKLAQTPVEDLTQAATTFQIAFGRMVDPTTLGQFNRMWVQLIGTAPGGVAAAPTIAQAIPGLASMFQLAPGRNVPAATSQAQLMGLTLGVLRTGMPPATAMRGLTYLLQSIAQPTGGARQALAGIGITPQTVERQGIYANTMRLLQTITARPGVARRLGAMTDDSLDQLDASGGNLPGVSAQEMVRLRAMIPRIHGIRAAIILASQLQQRGTTDSISGDVGMMMDAQNENSDTTRKLRQAWENLASRSRMQEAVNDLNVMGVAMAQFFNPLFNFVSSGIHFGLSPLMLNHRGAMQKGLVGGAAVLSAMTIGRAVGLGNLPGIRNVPLLGSLLRGSAGRGIIAAEAAQAAIRGGGPGMSPQNPLFVIVVGQLFGGAAAGGDSTTPVPTGPNPLRGLKKWAPWFAAGAIRGITVAGAATAGAAVGTAGLVLSLGGDTSSAQRKQGDYRFRHAAAAVDPRRYPHLARLIAATGSMDISAFPENQRNLLYRLERGQVTAAQAANILRGRADVNVQLQQVDANGRVIQTKRVAIPVDLFAGGVVPRSRGKAGRTTRK